MLVEQVSNPYEPSRSIAFDELAVIRMSRWLKRAA
jgi:hypothetical protein